MLLRCEEEKKQGSDREKERKKEKENAIREKERQEGDRLRKKETERKALALARRGGKKEGTREKSI